MSVKNFSINRICKLSGISKNSYYHTTDPQSRLVTKYSHIKSFVTKVIDKNSKYGIRRIKAGLKQRFDIDIGRDTLAKLLILWGLDLKRKIRKNKINMIRKILIMLSDKSNILIRSTINAPFQAISSDITEIYYGTGNKLFLCVHKDVFGQVVYGYSVGVKTNLELVLQSFTMAVNRIKRKLKLIPKSIIFHQDRGSVYTSYRYVDKVLAVGKISFSAPGTPTDNPGQESFFGRFKEEWADEIKQIDNQKEAIKFIQSKIKYYNQERIHTIIGYQTPNRFTNLFLKQQQNRFSKFST